jgi:isoleucyl-tRNA synthetase
LVADLAGIKIRTAISIFAEDRKCISSFCCTDFVTTGDGTGIVHLAPYGEDDFITYFKKKILNIPVAVDVSRKI